MRVVLSGAQLRAFDPAVGTNAKLDKYADCLGAAMGPAQITNVPRVSAFLAQLAWECAHFKTLIEYADGSAYEGRKDLGNYKPGDGKRYKGRGFIQLTGRANYKNIGAELGIPLEDNPMMAADPEVAARVACLYWTKRGLNAYADRYDLTFITRAINGAATEEAPSHLGKRARLYVRALETFGRSLTIVE